MRMRLNNQPLVSVLMGVYYQREDLEPLQRSIASILAQTYGELELLICDDGSIQSAKEVIDGIAEEFSEIATNAVNPPDETKIGFSMSLSTEGNLCVVKGEGSVTLNVEMTWKRNE